MDIQNGLMKSYFDVLMRSVNDAITAVDRNGIVLYWNEVAVDLYGIKKEQIIGKHIGEFFQYGSLMLFKIMATGTFVHQVYHTPRPGIHVFINGEPVYNESGQLIGAVAIEQNITNIVKLSRELYYNPDERFQSNLDFTYLKYHSSTQKNLNVSQDHSLLNYPVLLIGEPGVGKQALALMFHNHKNHNKPFHILSCNSIPQGLLETELFGYEDNILGENGKQKGKLEAAEHGTVYLKEIHAMPLSIQEKLADALNEKKFLRIGGTDPISLKSRVIASATRDIESLVEKGLFLKELYYALQVRYVPSLRERKEDIPELCYQLLNESAKNIGKPVPSLSQEAIASLTEYNWPANFPELKNVMDHLLIVSNGDNVTPEALPPKVRLNTLRDFVGHSVVSLDKMSIEMESNQIEQVLSKVNGNKSKAAKLLGISRGALYYKLKQYGLK